MEFSPSAPQAAVQQLARKFVNERVAPLSREMDEQGEMPLSLVNEMALVGLLGGPLSAEYGGGGWDKVSGVLCYEELGRSTHRSVGL